MSGSHLSAGDHGLGQGVPADDVPGDIVAVPHDYPPGFVVARHRHRRHQLVFSVSGVTTVHTAAGSWTVPVGLALWVPAGVEHSIRTTGRVGLRSVYFEPSVAPALSSTCQFLEVSGLLRELIVRAVRIGPTLCPERGLVESGALVQLLFEELEAAGRAPLRALHLPEGRDERLRRLTDELHRSPADPATLAEWGRRVGASERTLGRLFVCETGLSFTRWRRRLRVRRALELLALGHTVSDVAPEVGYDSLSAFVHGFRKETGQTPGSYRKKALRLGAYHELVTLRATR